MVDLNKYYRQGNRAKIHEAESSGNSDRASRLKSLKCGQNFAGSNFCDYDEIIATAELNTKIF